MFLYISEYKILRENTNCQLQQITSEFNVLVFPLHKKSSALLQIFHKLFMILDSLKISGARFACVIDQNIQVEQIYGPEFNYS